MNTPTLSKAIDVVGLQPLAKACGVTYQALRKWERQGRLPRTEWTGETDYAGKIVAACAGKNHFISRDDLLVIAKVGAGGTADRRADQVAA